MVPETVVANLGTEFRTLRDLADRAIAQVAAEDLFAPLDAESNSIAVILKHVAGNMRSRWTEFLTVDGERPDRNRDDEFLLCVEDTPARLLERWQEGWCRLFEALGPLTDADLGQTVLIRGEPHTALQAIHRQLTHSAYHVGQIVLLAKHFTLSRWKSLSIPRGQSEQFTATVKAAGRPPQAA